MRLAGALRCRRRSSYPATAPAARGSTSRGTVVRRAERIVAKLTHDGETRNDTPLKYLNRLSSLLFVMARVEDKAEGVEQFTLAAEE